MLEDYYVKPATVDRVRASWLAPQIESYLEWLESHRYSRLVVYRRLPLLFHFAEFAQKKGRKDVASCKAYIKEFVSQWLEQHGANAKTAVALRKHTIDAECGVRQMLQLACKDPVTRNRRRRPFPLKSEVPGFAEYLRSERGFAESTIRNYRRHLDEFAQYLSRTGITSFGQLSPAVLAAFIVQYRPKVAPRTRLGFCCHLRVLLRFCHRERVTTRDLSGAVGTPQIYRLNDVLNRKYCADAEVLRQFDRYLQSCQINGWSAINSLVIDDFLRSHPRRVSARSYNHLLGTVHRFFKFAVMQQWIERNPVTASPRPETAARIPYLFDLDTAKQLLAVARSFPEQSRARYRGLVYETIFAFLYGLGLRVGEVVRLTLADVDFARLLLIRESKFQKTRIVPFGPNLARRLKHYVEERHGCRPAPERPLFSFTKHGCICVGTISQTFHTLLPRLQLHIPPGVSPPRLHDLRHSFAVATLLRWYRQGIDPNCRLMHLATFLGHVDPNSTAVYLTITEELLNQAARRFQVLAPKGGVQ